MHGHGGMGFVADPPGRSERPISAHEPPLAAVLRALPIFFVPEGGLAAKVEPRPV